MLARLTRLLAVVVWVGVAVAAHAQEAGFKRIIAFGDSLTDDAVGLADTSGFNRYTNGEVWVEYLAADLGIARVDNFAWGGAKTGQGNANGFDWSGLQWQVERFSPSGDLSHALVTVWIGTNDLYDGEAVISASIGNVADALNTLAKKGAGHLLVLNLPDITLAPAYNAGNAYAAEAERAGALVRRFNRSLEAMLFEGDDSFTARHPDIRLHFLDVYSRFNELIASGAFENVQEPWFGTYEYPRPGEYLWWDNWHPMTEVHRRIAEAAAAILRAANGAGPDSVYRSSPVKGAIR